MKNNTSEINTIQQPPKTSSRDDAHIIVFGNEKGGSGKSTSAMHIAIALMRMGYRVGSIDLDARQGTLSKYMRNRFEFVKRARKYIPSPDHLAIERSAAESVEQQQSEERGFFGMAISEFRKSCDFIVVDTPGTDSYLSRLAHSYADTLITPLNDSFVDLDMLAEIDPADYEIKGPSVYSRMVEQQRVEKHLRGEGDLNWIVMRNRLSHINAKNKAMIGDLLGGIARQLDFRIAPGFGERVVFRELFLKGLTLLDLKPKPNAPLSDSQRSARQEVLELLRVLDPETLKGKRAPLRRKAG